MDSMSRILINLFLPTADTIVHNSRILFDQHCFVSSNMVPDSDHAKCTMVVNK